jgi:curved DNA-binding protein CbpA
MDSDFYAVLGVSRNATSDEIRERFLQLTRQMHPDRFHGDEKRHAEERFQAVTQAFNILSNPARRRAHDAELARPGQKSGADSEQVTKVFLQRGVKAYKAKNFLEAAENFRAATEADPKNAMAWHHLARACSHQPRFMPQAMAAVARACELDAMKPAYYKLAGDIFARGGQKEKAIGYYRQALRWGGEDAEIEDALAELEGRKRKSILGGIFGKMDK